MKKKQIKSALPIYGSAAVWLILGLICPKMLLKGYFLLIAAAISAAVYFGLSAVFKGRTVEVREAADSGDENVNRLIEEGRTRLDHLKQLNDAIPDAEITRNLDRMVHASDEIFKSLERDVDEANDMRRFMNYYLPTTEKLMETYRTLMDTRSSGENITRAMQSVENSLGMIATAFEKQMDKLYSDETLDVETDIQTMETLLASDGLAGGSFADVAAGAAKASPAEEKGSTAQTGN